MKFPLRLPRAEGVLREVVETLGSHSDTTETGSKLIGIAKHSKHFRFLFCFLLLIPGGFRFLRDSV